MAMTGNGALPRRTVLTGPRRRRADRDRRLPRLRPGAVLGADPARLPAAPHRHRRRLWPLVRAHRQAAVKVLNEAGGIDGRPVEIVFEDDGTDPKRGAEVVEKFASQHKDRGLRHAVLACRHRLGARARAS